jgi:uncharacterized protein (DUF2062 family)
MSGGMIRQWIKRKWHYRVIGVQEPPHRIAFAVALAIAVAWTPAMGLHMVLFLFLAWLLGANWLIGLPIVWVSNPLTIIPIYYPNYLLGRLILGADEPAGNFFKAVTLSGGYFERVRTFWTGTAPYAAELWVGSLVMAMILSPIVYVLVRRAVTRHQLKHPVEPPASEEA